jgi:CTP:molybdopterin cytidylyltransferase MocA
MRGSLQEGVRGLPHDVAAALVALADMPLVTAEMMRAVAERYRRGAAPLVISRYGEVTAPPTLYDRSLFPELLAMAGAGAGAGKPVVRAHEEEAEVVDWPAAALADLDAPGDYDRLS